MANEAIARFSLRLEDAVALLFFLFSLVLRLVFRELEFHKFDPSDVFIIVPSVVLLIGKELIHYFVAGKQPSSADASPLDFIKPFWTIVRDWFPFLIVLLMYYSMWGDIARLLGRPDMDQQLIALDRRIFGFQASLALQRIISPALTSWMSFAYFYHVINIPVIACYIYIFKSRVRFRESMCGLLVLLFFGITGYILVPAVGPMYSLRAQYTVPLSQALGLFSREMEFMDIARVQRDVFPSLHVGISFIMWLYAWRNSRKLAWILSPLIISLWVSTLYLRYHYFVDVIAGFILAPLCFFLSNWIFKQCGVIPLKVRIPRVLAARFPWLISTPPALEEAEKAGNQP
jgi:membrane-associated phospholipid phosphatase